MAVHRTDIHGDRDPVFFLGYWKNEDATRDKYTRRVVPHRRSRAAGRGRLPLVPGPRDDVFKAAGYRIGPSEIENCLVKHPAVANAAVVPRPDAERGNVVKAFIVLTPGYAAVGVAGGRDPQRTCAAGSRPTSTRRRSSSSTRCR